jgi:hypothetical protein
VIIIRFFAAPSGCLIGFLSILAIPAIFLLYYTAEQEQVTPPPIYSASCQFGLYNSGSNKWEPLVDGNWPSPRSGFTYTAKVTVTNISSNQILTPDDAPTVTLLPSSTPWQVDRETQPVYQGYTPGPQTALNVDPGVSIVDYAPLFLAPTGTPPPTGCTVDTP